MLNEAEKYMLYIFDQINKEKDKKEAAEKQNK
ncbi:hypothetical protein BJV93_002813 [Clostridium butyricum]|nr:hypothetical protein [Clostridium butyricum]